MNRHYNIKTLDDIPKPERRVERTEVLGIVAIMAKQGITENELSRMTGITQSYINRLKNERITPTVKTAAKICSALNTTIEDAFIRRQIVEKMG